MKFDWRLVCLLLLASAWGMSELLGGETIWLTTRALLLLAVARTLIDRPGSSSAMGGIAVLFKSINTAPFLCHLAGIALLGIAFDVAATLFWRDDARRFLRAALAGASAAYLSSFLFAASMVWIVHFRSWDGGGPGLVAEHTLTSGSLGAVAGLVVVPAGLWVGRHLDRRAAGEPRLALGAAAAGCLVVWIAGALAG
ncbi:MAG: hypothetical protein PVF43_14315 [Candidatus Eiseniibacteriota bacterium]|jgi:hypothetical protein